MPLFKLASGEVFRYGLILPPKEDGTPLNLLEVEMACFLRGGSPEASKYEHCIAGMRLLWPKIDYHDWFLEEVEEFCKTKFTGVTGAASSSKSFGMAAYCLFDWYCDPLNTLSFIVSNTLKDARQRIWSYVQSLHQTAAYPMPGRIIHSTDALALRDMPAGQEGTEQSQITLVAAGEADAVQRLQGKKNKRVRVYGDEGQDIHTALGAAIFNLRTNPDFEMRLIGNASSQYSYHGMFCEPIAALGGHSYDYELEHSWPILVMGMYPGTCLHFNDIWSPNFKREALGLPIYPYLPRPDEVRLTRQTLGRDEPILWRQHIGVWPKGNGVRQTVFTEPEVNKWKMRQLCAFTTSKRGFGIDPSYTADGDKFALRPFDWGKCGDGISRILFHPVIAVPDAPYFEDDGQEYRGSFARAKRVRDLAIEHGVSAEFIGIDDTGRNPFKHILDAELGGAVLGVGFGDGASDDVPVSVEDETLSKDAYADKGTEMWYSLRSFAEHDQVRGLSDTATIQQLTNRRFVMKARGKVRLQSKKEYKAQMGGQSPDDADATAICTAVVRERMGGIAGLAVVEERQAIFARDARVAARVQPPRLGGQRGVGRMQYVSR